MTPESYSLTTSQRRGQGSSHTGPDDTSHTQSAMKHTRHGRDGAPLAASGGPRTRDEIYPQLILQL